jgi:hypothetical protein
MTLPLTRNTTYVALQQVLSADLNALQDGVIASGGAQTIFQQHAQPEFDQTAVAPYWGRIGAAGTWKQTTGTAANGRLYFGLELPAGSIVSNARLVWFPANNADAWTCGLYAITYDSATPLYPVPGSTKANFGLTPGASVIRADDLTPASPYTVGASEVMELQVFVGANNLHEIIGVLWTVDQMYT